MLPKHEEKAYIQIREEEIRKKWANYQEGESLQQTFTPLSLTYEMLQKLPSLEDKDVLVVANIETVLFLSTLKRDGHVNFNKLHFLTDIKKLEGKEGVSYISFDELDKVDLGMKFDVAIANPPYNTDSSSTEGSEHKHKTRFIGKEFLEWLPTISKHSAVICPTRGYWTGRNKVSTGRRLKSLGLYAVESTQAFEKLVNLRGIGVYYFKQGYSGNVQDSFSSEHTIPEHNLSQILTYGSNKLIAGAVKKLSFDPGEDTLYITATKSVIKGIDTSQLQDPTRGSWRAILPQNAGDDNYGTPRLIRPNDAITYSVVCFPVSDEDTGKKLIEYLNREDIKKLVVGFRSSATNSKYNFSVIPTPDFLLVD